MEKLNVSSNPHIRSNVSTSTIMLDVIIALFPATVVGIAMFGSRALFLVLACVISSVAAEAIYQKCMKQKITVGDYSAVLTGLLLALNLSVNMPIWMAVLGSVFAIIIVKQLFGGVGQNFMNPALAARCFLFIAFAGPMTNFAVDTMTGPTPLAIVKEAGNAGTSVTSALLDNGFSLLDMFIGTTTGTIGETSTLALLAGAAYLLIKRIIHIRIPGIYILTVMIFMSIFSISTRGTLDFEFLAAELCGGGLIIGAFFMATDYATSPITVKGQVVFAILLGVLTSVFRLFGPTAEGVSYSIIIANLFVPLIERVTVPKFFGEGAMKK